MVRTRIDGKRHLPVMLGSTVRFVLAGLVLGYALVGTTAGCDGATCEEQGGVVVLDEDGEQVCEGKCDPSLCVEGNTCVNNRCRLVCDAHTDCFQASAGSEITQACLPVTADSATGLLDGPTVNICETSPKATAIGVACQDDSACAGSTVCPDGSDCALGGCAPEACRPLACRTTGEVDEDAYCTTVDCAADTDCAPGMFCSTVRVVGTATDCPSADGPEDKGDGDPEIPCDQLAAFNAANGTTYQEGPETLVRNVCVKRTACAPCVTSVDCSLEEGAACVTVGSTTHCANACTSDEECPSDYLCAPASSPAAGHCIPRSGTCVPPAGSTFCHSCRTDSDCGSAGSTWACGEDDADAQVCFDTALSATCTVDEDCPTSPSGEHGRCLDDEDGVEPSQDLYHRCYFPARGNLSYSCWP